MTEQVFVARERELSQLRTYLALALAGLSAVPAQAGHAQVCFVTGEAGAVNIETTRRPQETGASQTHPQERPDE